MMDLMGGAPAAPAAPMPAPMPAQQAPAPAPMAPAPAATSGPAPFTVYNENGLTITFACESVAANPQGTKITASFANATGAPIENLQMQCAVPKYIQLQMNPPTGSMVPPGSSGAVTQQLNIINTMRGTKPVMMKLKISFVANGGQQVNELASVGASTFPAGL